MARGRLFVEGGSYRWGESGRGRSVCLYRMESLAVRRRCLPRWTVSYFRSRDNEISDFDLRGRRSLRFGFSKLQSKVVDDYIGYSLVYPSDLWLYTHSHTQKVVSSTKSNHVIQNKKDRPIFPSEINLDPQLGSGSNTTPAPASIPLELQLDPNTIRSGRLCRSCRRSTITLLGYREGWNCEGMGFAA